MVLDTGSRLSRSPTAVKLSVFTQLYRSVCRPVEAAKRCWPIRGGTMLRQCPGYCASGVQGCTGRCDSQCAATASYPLIFFEGSSARQFWGASLFIPSQGTYRRSSQASTRLKYRKVDISCWVTVASPRLETCCRVSTRKSRRVSLRLDSAFYRPKHQTATGTGESLVNTRD